MIFHPHPVAAQPDALTEVLAVSEDFDAVQAMRYAAIDRMRQEFFAALPGATGSEHEMARRSLRLELASALRVTEYSAEVLIDTAESLVHRHPDALEALGQGRITDQHARAIVSRLAVLDADVRSVIAPDALALAEEFPVGVFRRKLNALIETALQPTIAQRHIDAVARRRVDVTAQPDGMATLEVYAPAVEVHAIHGRITAMAKAIKGHGVAGDTDPAEARTLDQLRADVACDLLIDGETSDHPEQARGIRATVAVTVPALTLLDEAAGDAAVVEGLGPIPLVRAKELCGGASDWMRVLTHPETGMVLSVGRTQYRPPAALRRLVTWRSERCMAPGCSIPASRCEIDHTLAWADGGTTAAQNLAPLCKGHHTVKHHGDWTVRQVPHSGGVLEWTSPTGRRYLVEPERRIPTFRPSGDPSPPVVTAHAPF